MTMNGETCIATPHEVDPIRFGPNKVWSTPLPVDSSQSEDGWIDGLGQDQIAIRRIWAIIEPKGQIAAFKKLLADFPDRGLDMLVATAGKGKLHVVKILLEAGIRATPDAAKGDDETLVPLDEACYQGRLEIVKYFIEELGLDVDHRNYRGGTPLMKACWGGKVEVVQYVLEEDADVFIRTYDGNKSSAFEVAAGGGSVEVMDLLLDKANEVRGDRGYCELLTSMALAAAATCKSATYRIPGQLGPLIFLLKEMRYPIPKEFEGGKPPEAKLTTDQKFALEAAFFRALRAQSMMPINILLSYLTSVDPLSGQANFPALESDTLDTLVERVPAIIEMEGDEDLAHADLNLLQHVCMLSLTESASSPETHLETINGIFIQAAIDGNLRCMQLLATVCPDIDVNAISKRVEQPVTAMYMAAGKPTLDMLQWLIQHFTADSIPPERRLDPHRGNGMYVNGPTVLWQSVWQGQADVAILLLRTFHGPVDELAIPRGMTQADLKVPLKVSLCAFKAFRSPVHLFVLEGEMLEHWGKQQPMKSAGLDYEDGEVEGMTAWLELTEEDLPWLNHMQLREEDAVLERKEKGQTDGVPWRTLKPLPDMQVPEDEDAKYSRLDGPIFHGTQELSRQSSSEPQQGTKTPMRLQAQARVVIDGGALQEAAGGAT